MNAFLARWALRALLSALAAVTVLFPDPVLLARQVRHVHDVEGLIQTDFPGMADIQRAIDAELPAGAGRREELRAVERFVCLAVPYAHDWDTWTNLDYWPTAAETWARRREDCDGRAVLAASILRARGHPEARLAGNLRHIWVVAGEDRLMSPQAEGHMDSAGGRLTVSMPSGRLLLLALADNLAAFPAHRSLLLAALLLLVHAWPCVRPGPLALALGAGGAGMAVLLAWAGRPAGLAPGAAGLAACAAAWLLALWISHRARRRGDAPLRAAYAACCRLLYGPLAPAYDLVSQVVSLGRWDDWRRIALPLAGGGRVLELGFGTGHLQEELAREGRAVFGADPSPAMQRLTGRRLARAGLRTARVRAVGERLPFADGAFDAVVATFPERYWLGPRNLRECRRVLAPGGRLVGVGAWVETDRVLPRLLFGAFYRPPGAAADKLRADLAAAGFSPAIRPEPAGHARVWVVTAARVPAC